LKLARGGELFDGFAVQGLHGDAVGGGIEDHLLVGAGERGEHDVLALGIHGQDLVERLVRGPAFHRPDRPAEGNVDS
jgi:hypothetical protein